MYLQNFVNARKVCAACTYAPCAKKPFPLTSFNIPICIQGHFYPETRDSRMFRKILRFVLKYRKTKLVKLLVIKMANNLFVCQSFDKAYTVKWSELQHTSSNFYGIVTELKPIKKICEWP